MKLFAVSVLKPCSINKEVGASGVQQVSYLFTMNGVICITEQKQECSAIAYMLRFLLFIVKKRYVILLVLIKLFIVTME